MIRIAVWGNPGLTARLQKTLENEVSLEDISWKYPDRKPFFKRLSILISFLTSIKPYKYVMLYAFPKMWIFLLCAKLMGKRTIVYWIGTDCYKLQENPASYLIKKGDINLSHSVSLQKELLEFDVHTNLLTILPQGIDLSIGEMPKEHAVLFYIPEGREDFYGYNWITTLINRFPELKFHIVANGKKELFPSENAVVHGMIPPTEMEKLYNDISIVLRFPAHDSLSISIMEAMFKAKIIIYRYEQDYTIRAKTIEEFISRLEEQISNPPKPVFEAHEYALRHFAPDAVKKQFQDIVAKYDLS